MSDAFGYTTADGETTDGWSGSDASHARASAEQKSGRNARRRLQVLEKVRLSGLHGVTWFEIADALNIHHGAASGALSNLHKAQRIQRLKEQRGGSSIYVMPHAVNDRPTAPFGRVRPAKPPVEVLGQPDDLEALRRDLDAAHAAVEVARQEGHDLGWQEGYDRGVVDAVARPSTEQRAAERRAYDEGVEIGKRQERDRMGRYLDALIVEYKRLTPQVIAGHHSKCWLGHPQCAVEMIRRGLSKAAA